MPTKIRLDQLLVERGMVPSRNKAQALIMAGEVLVSDTPAEKPGERFPVDASIRIRSEASRFVGRGGEKINSIFDFFTISLEHITALDVGASTGGFTDCMLQRGASKVYAVDVGYNQLAMKLRQDSRVVVFERTNAKTLSQDMFDPLPTLATIDVSFIGLRKILPSVLTVLSGSCEILCLVKPQFELGPEYVSEGGVVRSEKDQRLAVALVEDEAKKLELEVVGSLPSPLRGEKKGNQEYFLYLRKECEQT